MTFNTGLNRRAVQGGGLRPVASGIAGSNPTEDMDICLVCAVCCQVDVSASSRSLVERSPTECVCVCVSEFNLETSTMRKPWLTGAVLFTCNLRHPAPPCSAFVAKPAIQHQS
jgi:hypothetical protein